ncbi:MAG TPA: hypothetical protein VK988_02300, partial [Acidimicrobiales bacterium]|nr:hypothetical protein [Acidimicrobiales bacterium]
LALLVDLVFGDEVQAAELSMRLDSFLDQLGANPLTTSQERIVAAVNTRIEALVRHAFEGLGQWQTMLRGIANQLEDLERRAHGDLTLEEHSLAPEQLVAHDVGLDDEEDTNDEGGID